MLMLAEVNVVQFVFVLLFLAAVAAGIHYWGTKMNKVVLWLLNGAIIVVAVLYVLDAFGIWDMVKGTKVPRF